MTQRDQLHSRISDLLQTLNINNNRLSLHAEQVSELDVDVLRKQCIDLYETINLLPYASSSSSVADVENAPEKTDENVEPEVVKEKEDQPEAEHSVTEIADEIIAEEETEPIKEKPVKEKEAPAKEEPKRSIHMKLQDEAEMVSLFEKFNSKPIDSIAKAITISKRFEFQNNFFDGDAQNYKKFIELIDSASDREDAFQIYHEYKNKLGWDNEDLKDELKSLLYRKYAT